MTFLIPLIIIQLILQAWALYDMWQHRGAKYSTPLWLVCVLVFQILGVVLYFLFGRRAEA